MAGRRKPLFLATAMDDTAQEQARQVGQSAVTAHAAANTPQGSHLHLGRFENAKSALPFGHLHGMIFDHSKIHFIAGSIGDKTFAPLPGFTYFRVGIFFLALSIEMQL